MKIIYLSFIFCCLFIVLLDIVKKRKEKKFYICECFIILFIVFLFCLFKSYNYKRNGDVF